MEELKKAWKILFIIGIIIGSLGLLAIASPLVPGIALIVLFGIILSARGGAQLIFAFRARKWQGIAFEFLGGALYLLAGLMLMSRPGIGLAGLTLLLAILIIMQGIFDITLAFQIPKELGRIWRLINGMVSIFLGIMIWSQWPYSAMWFIGLIIGINLLVKGLALIPFALALKKASAEQ